MGEAVCNEVLNDWGGMVAILLRAGHDTPLSPFCNPVLLRGGLSSWQRVQLANRPAAKSSGMC